MAAPQKSAKGLGGMAEALAITVDLGFPAPPAQDDKNIVRLTHVSVMEMKCESLARIIAILKDVIQNKDHIIARLQQPCSLDCISVEAEYQKQFSELLLKAASDYGAMTTSVGDFQWSQNFRVTCPV